MPKPSLPPVELRRRYKANFTREYRGVARGGPGVPVTPLGRSSFEQTTYNIQVAKTP